LKIEVTNLIEEMEEVKTHDGKRKKVLKESKELVNHINTQLEEIK